MLKTVSAPLGSTCYLATAANREIRIAEADAGIENQSREGFDFGTWLERL